MTDKIKDGPAFQLYAADFYMDIVGWSTTQVGIYFRLLMYEWVNEALPNDIKRLARIAGIDVGNFKKCYLQDIANKFVPNGNGNLINKRLEETREKQRQYKENQAESGRRGVEVKKKKGIFPFDKSSDPSSDPSTDSASENQALHLHSSYKDIKDIPISIILKDGTYYELGTKKIAQYQQTYKRIDVIQELKNCAQWNEDNPTKRKTMTGILRHINTWLAKANANIVSIRQAPEPDLEAQKERDEYLKKFSQKDLDKRKGEIGKLGDILPKPPK